MLDMKSAVGVSKRIHTHSHRRHDLCGTAKILVAELVIAKEARTNPASR